MPRLTNGSAAKEEPARDGASGGGEAGPLLRVAIVHDREYMRRGLADCLRELGGYELVLSVAAGGTLLTACRKGLAVDLALVQLRTTGMDGCATLVLLREHWPTIGRLALCEEADAELSRRALCAEVQALLPLGGDAGALAAALAAVQDGRFHMNDLVKALFHHAPKALPRRGRAQGCPLTPKEMETLCWKAHPGGFTVGRIAIFQEVKRSTVSSHMKQIRRKLGVRSGAEAVRRAQKLGLLPGWEQAHH